MAGPLLTYARVGTDTRWQFFQRFSFAGGVIRAGRKPGATFHPFPLFLSSARRNPR